MIGKQARLGRCDCWQVTLITTTPSPYEFDWRCSTCPAAGTISWAHANSPPVFAAIEPEQQRTLGFDFAAEKATPR